MGGMTAQTSVDVRPLRRVARLRSGLADPQHRAPLLQYLWRGDILTWLTAPDPASAPSSCGLCSVWRWRRVSGGAAVTPGTAQVN
jgi:hypothetical protein